MLERAKNLGGPRSPGNQAFRCLPEAALADLVLLDHKHDLGLALLQLARLSVVFVLRNSPAESLGCFPSVSSPPVDLIKPA